jgi:hypothetical protein
MPTVCEVDENQHLWMMLQNDLLGGNELEVKRCEKCIAVNRRSWLVVIDSLSWCIELYAS